MNVLVVFDYPRRKSQSGLVLDQFVECPREGGHTSEVAGLHTEQFDLRMPVADEPNLRGGAQSFTEALQREQARVERNDAVAFIFPNYGVTRKFPVAFFVVT